MLSIDSVASSLMKCDSIGQCYRAFQINAKMKSIHQGCKSGLEKCRKFPRFLSPVMRTNCLEKCLTGSSLVGYRVRCGING